MSEGKHARIRKKILSLSFSLKHVGLLVFQFFTLNRDMSTEKYFFRKHAICLMINGLSYLGSVLVRKQRVVEPRPPGEPLFSLNETVTSQLWPIDAMHNMNSEILRLFIFRREGHLLIFKYRKNFENSIYWPNKYVG